MKIEFVGWWDLLVIWCPLSKIIHHFSSVARLYFNNANVSCSWKIRYRWRDGKNIRHTSSMDKRKDGNKHRYLCDPIKCFRYWDENPITSETEPSSDPPIQNPGFLDSRTRWRQLRCPHIVLRSREANSSCYLQKILLKIMGPSSLYWWCKARRSQNFYLTTVSYCCKNIHRFVAEKLLLLSYWFYKSHSTTPFVSRFWTRCYQQHGVPIMYCLAHSEHCMLEAICPQPRHFYRNLHPTVWKGIFCSISPPQSCPLPLILQFPGHQLLRSAWRPGLQSLGNITQWY